MCFCPSQISIRQLSATEDDEDCVIDLASIIRDSPLDPDPGEAFSTFSEDDGDPASIADVFGRSVTSPWATSTETGQTELRLPPLTSTMLCSSVLAESARRRTDFGSAPLRRSNRVMSKDSGFAENDDSRGSGGDSGSSRLDDFWRGRRKYWEMSDIRDEVHELLGFYPSDSPPRAAAASVQGTRTKTPLLDVRPKSRRSSGKEIVEVVDVDLSASARDRESSTKVTVSRRSGRKIRPPEHMDM